MKLKCFTFHAMLGICLREAASAMLTDRLKRCVAFTIMLEIVDEHVSIGAATETGFWF